MEITQKFVERYFDDNFQCLYATHDNTEHVHSHILFHSVSWRTGNQEEHYKILQKADDVGESMEFVEFMLGMIRNALKEISETHNKTNVAINDGVNVVTNEEKIIVLLRMDGNMSANMLSVSSGVTQEQARHILAKLKAEGKIIRHGANKNGYWEVIE